MDVERLLHCGRSREEKAMCLPSGTPLPTPRLSDRIALDRQERRRGIIRTLSVSMLLTLSKRHNALKPDPPLSTKEQSYHFSTFPLLLALPTNSSAFVQARQELNTMARGDASEITSDLGSKMMSETPGLASSAEVARDVLD